MGMERFTALERHALMAVLHDFLRMMPSVSSPELVARGELSGSQLRTLVEAGFVMARDDAATSVPLDALAAACGAVESYLGLLHDDREKIFRQIWERSHWFVSPKELLEAVGSAHGKLSRANA